MINWVFPHGKKLTPKGVNNSSIEIFLDNIADSLTREVIQNSLDAHNPDVKEPVKVVFDFNTIPTKMIPDFDSIKNNALPKAIELWKEINNPDTLKFLERFNEILSNEEIAILKISDYNTKGLNAKNYKSLVEGDGYSEKDNESSAGSKGIGKAAPFAASDLRMVFYNTVSTENLEKSAGIMNFVSFNYPGEDNHITQERASYLDESKGYIESQFTFGSQKRAEEEYGTDLFIIGLKPFENWNEKIILSTINNFLLSIINGKLEVLIANQLINKETLPQIIQSIFERNNLKSAEKANFLKTTRFYEVLVHESTLLFNLDERFKEYSFIDELSDATLQLLEHESANRSILQTREAGMKISERKGISSNINFTGVFQATGKKLNAFLKDLENANHDKWSTDRKFGNERKEANAFLLDLFHWYKDLVKESFATAAQNNIDAFGVNDLLPLNNDTTDGNQNSEDSGIKNTINTAVIKRKNLNTSSVEGEKEEELLKKAMESAGLGEGDSSGGGSNREGSGGGDNPDNFYGHGEDNGTNSPNDDSDNKTFTQVEKRVGPSNSCQLKIIEVDALKGQYRIIGKSNKKCHAIEIEMHSVGANGTAYDIKILDCSSTTHSASISKNAIRVPAVTRNKPISVDFKINSRLRMKMGETVYEIKG